MTDKILKTLGRMEAKIDQHSNDIKEIKASQADLREEITRYKGFISGVRYIAGGLVVGAFALFKVLVNKT